MTDNPFASPEDLSAEAAAPATVATDGAPDAVVVADHMDQSSLLPAYAAVEPQQKQARARVGAGTVALIAGGALLIGGLGGVGAAVAYDNMNDDASTQTTTATLPASDTKDTSKQLEDGSVSSIAASVLPSVVSIEAATADGRASTGSGFIVSEDGYIATNNHVIDGADGSIKVLFSDGTVVDATVVGASSDYDLAVLKVDKGGLEPLVLGNSDEMVVGDPVLAIGSPLGLDSTVTTGIISALHRAVTTSSETSSDAAFIDAIQTDAAINPGNSGGPLINAAGQVIGINSAIANLAQSSAQAGSVGLGFAIPSNQVRRTVDELIATGKATYPVVGILLDPTNQEAGVLVATDVDGQPGVVVGGPADKAGVEPGDIITAIDGRTITRADDLVVAIRSKAPGDTVTLTIKRDGNEQDVKVTLASNTDVSFGDEPSPAPSN
jgi:putative serine protease PepD